MIFLTYVPNRETIVITHERVQPFFCICLKHIKCACSIMKLH